MHSVYLQNFDFLVRKFKKENINSQKKNPPQIHRTECLYAYIYFVITRDNQNQLWSHSKPPLKLVSKKCKNVER